MWITVVVPDDDVLDDLGGAPGLRARMAALGGGRRLLAAPGEPEPADVAAVLHLHDPPDEDEVLRLLPDTWAWEIDPHHVWDRLEGRVPHTVRSVLLRRHPDLDPDAFARRWTVQHAELARRHHPGVARYTQHVTVVPLTADTPEVDGIAELAYATEHDRLERQYDSPEGGDAIRVDVAGFLDLAGGRRLLGVEVAIPGVVRH